MPAQENVIPDYNEDEEYYEEEQEEEEASSYPITNTTSSYPAIPPLADVSTAASSVTAEESLQQALNASYWLGYWTAVHKVNVRALDLSSGPRKILIGTLYLAGSWPNFRLCGFHGGCSELFESRNSGCYSS